MKIEELSDDFADKAHIATPQEPAADLLTQAMNAFSSSAPAAAQDGTPQLPPGLAALRDKSGDEILAELNKTPLFMTSLEENDDLEALKALAYEGTPLEVASGFKERGNESFREKGWKDAKEFYGKAIQVLLIEVRKRQKGEDDATVGEEEVQREVAVLEACLVNRAASHLELKNYRSCVMDCGSTIKINTRNIKAYYRSAKALLALDKIAEADDACARGLAIEADNKPLLSIAQAIIKRNELVAEKNRKEAEREVRRRREVVVLSAALQARNIKTRKTGQPPEMEDAKVELVPDPIDPASSLTFPTVLLYPLALETDFIKAFNEMQTLAEHLAYILPLPWDKDGEYTTESVNCYMETITGGLIKIGKKVHLLKVLSETDVEVVDEVLRIHIVPRAKAKAWTTEFKTKKAAGKTESLKPTESPKPTE